MNIRIVPHASSCFDVNEQSPTKKQKMIDDFKTAQCLDNLRRAFETQNSAQIIFMSVAEEKGKDRSKAVSVWQTKCKDAFYGSGLFHRDDLMTKSGAKASPRYFYESYLKQYVGNLFLGTVKAMWKMGIFEAYKPEEKPFVLFSKQVLFPDDINPKIEAYIPLRDLIDTGLIFPDIMTFNPLANEVGFENAKPIAYGLFHSLYYGFNFATAFFRNFRGEWGYRCAVFERFKVGEVGSIRNSK